MLTTQIDTFGLHILCIDDSRTQLVLYKNELEGIYKITCALTYEESIAALTTQKPDLIILDINMPQVNGLEFLDILRFAPQYASIPVIIVSSDENSSDIKEAFRRGAADYVRKPYDSEELILRIGRIFSLLTPREKKEKELISNFNAAQSMLIASLTNLSKAKDNENTRHLDTVSLYSEALLKTAIKTPRFKNELTENFIQNITELSKLHDIGKVNMSEHILKKESPLTDREFELIKRHTTDGARTIAMIRLSFPEYAFLDSAYELILWHHERWDGGGYPEGKKELDIPLAARIMAIIDTFDAMTLDKVYAPSVPFKEAFDYILSQSKKAFDPDLVAIFGLCRSAFEKIYEENRRL